MVTKQCRMCRTSFDLNVTQEQVDRWQQGMLIQDAMPNLTPGERELFLTGWCNDCFDKALSEPEEDDTEDPLGVDFDDALLELDDDPPDWEPGDGMLITEELLKDDRERFYSDESIHHQPDE